MQRECSLSKYWIYINICKQYQDLILKENYPRIAELGMK
jgi:hypothetical protein